MRGRPEARAGRQYPRRSLRPPVRRSPDAKRSIPVMRPSNLLQFAEGVATLEHQRAAAHRQTAREEGVHRPASPPEARRATLKTVATGRGPLALRWPSAATPRIPARSSGDADNR